MSKAFRKPDRTLLGTALWNGWTTAFRCVLLLFGLPALLILLQIPQLLNALVLVRYFHHCLQSECHVRILGLGRCSLIVDKTEVVEFPVRQVRVKAFEDIPRAIANSNCNDTKRNHRRVNDRFNCCRLLRYLAISDNNKDVVFACLTDNVHCFHDDRRQTGWTA